MKLSIRTALVASATALLAACGGGRDNVVLPVAEDAPQAYTDVYLAAHPEALIQPEHLLIVNLDPRKAGGGVVRVRLHVAQPIEMQMGPSGASAAKVLSELVIQDAAGTEKFHYRDGQGPAQVALDVGEHAIIFYPKRDAETAHAVFVKLADTPAQLARQQQRVPSGLLGAAETLQATKFGENCTSCDFSNADLTAATFRYANVSYSTFHNATMNGVDFTGTFCIQCQLTAELSQTPMGITNSTFDMADLDDAVLDRPYFASSSFKAVSLSHATVRGLFVHCDFSFYVQPYSSAIWRTNFSYSNLSSAMFDSDNNFASAVMTAAQVSATTFSLDLSSPLAVRTAFAGAILDNLSPGTVFVDGNQQFAGYDLSGTSFTGIDLSTQDLSATAGVTFSATTDFSKAILSNGTRGVSFAGQSFPTGYAGFAGTEADANSGRDMRGVNLSNASLYQADLTRARLDGAVMVGVNLSFANLYHASLAGAQLGVAPGTGTQAGARLDNVYMPGANFSDADLRSVSMSGAHIYGTGVSFQRARLDAASLDGAYLMQASFVSASLNDTSLAGASLVDATFDAATLNNAKLTSAYLQGADFGSAAALVGVDLTNANVATSDDTWQFTEIDGTPYSFAYTSTNLGIMGVSSSQVVCPSGDIGPCTGAKLVSTKVPPYPVKPPCIPLRKYQYLNCEAGWTPPSS